MKNYFFGLIITLFFISCKKKQYLITDYIDNNLYLERYVSADYGAYGMSEVSYITDSTNFRKKIGYCDEKEGFFFDSIQNNTLKIVKYTRRGTPEFTNTDSFVLNINELIKNKDWDN